jgi:hypothetical protein
MRRPVSSRALCVRSWRSSVLVILGVSLAAGPLAASAANLLDGPPYYLLERPLHAQASAQPEPPTPQEPERPKPQKPLEQLLLEQGAILLRRGTLQVEPSIDYSHFSSDRVAISGLTIFEAIIIGLIQVDKLDRDLVTGTLTTRYGLLDRVQVEAKVPYVYRHDRETLAVGTGEERERTIDGHGIGDVEASILGQAFIGTEVLPDVILKLRGRFPTGRSPFDVETEQTPGGTRLKELPTGAGFYTINPGITLVWRIDPVVFFVGGSYSFNLAREFGGFGKVDPGDTVEFFAGLNLAVSDRVAVNMSFVNQRTGSTKQDGDSRSGTSFTDARLIFGSSIAVRPNMSLLLSVGAGLTRESPDYSVTFSIPISFSLF